MTFSNSLADGTKPLILDTSVLINLHASQRGEPILDALPNKILVPRQVIEELDLLLGFQSRAHRGLSGCRRGRGKHDGHTPIRGRSEKRRT